MTFFQSFILGIVQGITEFLPISSTGHLILTSKILGVTQTDFVKTFEISIQGGTILSVVFLYWRRLFLDMETIKRLIVAFIPTGIFGFLIYKVVKKVFLGHTSIVLWALFIGGILIILFERFYRGQRGQTPVSPYRISYKQAFLIGCFQSLAMIPGVSRSAATIIGGLSLGIPRYVIVEFSFLLAVPTLLAATLFDLIKSAPAFQASDIKLLLFGSFVAFLTAIFVIRFFLRFVRSHGFTVFGIYRIVLALVFWFFVAQVSS